MNFATATHIGYVREENQDCVEIRTFPDGVLALVCDGMGENAPEKKPVPVQLKFFWNAWRNAVKSRCRPMKSEMQ